MVGWLTGRATEREVASNVTRRLRMHRQRKAAMKRQPRSFEEDPASGPVRGAAILEMPRKKLEPIC